MSLIRALIRPNRTELVVTGVMALLMLAVVAIAVVRLASLDIPRECQSGLGPAQPSCGPNDAITYQQAAGQVLPFALAATLVVPALASISLGIAMIAREIEQQTSVLAWSLSPSRVRWLALRLTPVLVALLALSLVAGSLGDLIGGLRDPSVDSSQSLDGLGSRGVAVAGAALAVLGIALFVGAVLGRQLLAILMSAALVVAAFQLVSGITDGWLRDDAVAGAAEAAYPGARALDALVRTPEGEYLHYDEAYARYGPDLDQLLGAEGSGFTQALLYVPGALYLVATARIAAMLAAIGLLTILATFVVVHRRRPY